MSRFRKDNTPKLPGGNRQKLAESDARIAQARHEQRLAEQRKAQEEAAAAVKAFQKRTQEDQR